MGNGYDMTPKTPERAEKICGVPADTISSLAAEIASVDKVDFNCAQDVYKRQADAEFRVDVGDVRFHRVLGKHQFFLDEGSRSSLSEEDEYLRFAGRKLVRDCDVFASNRDGA